ncbi:diaminopimelate epimerase [Actinomycetaceae bacterium TAE3-ERU4]|nr:diaminopimelate epimerase [Actinomycetaceae bacterium TAE3-ERU4]
MKNKEVSMNLESSPRLFKLEGTKNDFLFYVPELDGQRDFSVQEIATLCDRRAGFGADGLVIAARKQNDVWFMDYRNADGTLAQMCGNAIRCMAHLLVSKGIIDLPVGQKMEIETRGGIREIQRIDQEHYRVEMGAALVSKHSYKVDIPGVKGTRRGIYVQMPNPHLVVEVSEEELSSAQLYLAESGRPSPTYNPPLPDGVNLELITYESSGIKTRVLERGVGETLSCGTGACAVAVAANLDNKEAVRVNLPGGTLIIGVREKEGKPDVAMTGPARLIGEVFPTV